MNPQSLILIPRIFRIALLALAGFGFLAHAQQSVFWRDSSGTDLWENNSANPWFYATWTSNERRPDIFPIPTRNFAFIGNNYNTTMDVNSSTWYGLGSLTVQAAAGSDRTYNATGSAGISFTLGLYVDTSANQTFNTEIGVDGASVEFRGNNGSSTIALTDSLFLNNNTAQFGGDSASTSFNVTGTASGSGGSIQKVNDNTLTLTGNNTYTGGTTLAGGTLRAGNNNALGTGTLTIDGVAANAKTLSSNNGSARTLSNNVNLFNALTLGQASGGTGSLTLGGTVYVGDSGSTRIVTTDGTHQISGPLTGSLGLAKQGTGTLDLSGSSTHSGGVYIDNGTLEVSGGSLASAFLDIGGSVQPQTGNNATLEISAPVTLTMPVTSKNFGTGSGTRSLDFTNGSGTPEISGTVFLEKALTVSSATQAEISGDVSGPGGLTKNGAGSLTLSGANTQTGTTTVNTGSLVLGPSGALVNSPLIIVGASGTLDASAVSGGSTIGTGQTLTTAGTLSGGSGGFEVSGGSFTQTAGTWSADVFRMDGSGGTVDLADLALSSGGTLEYAVDSSGTTAINLTDTNPFELYDVSPVAGLTAWNGNWEVSVNANLLPVEFPSSIVLMTSSAYDLSNLDGLLTLNAKNSSNVDTSYVGLSDGQQIFLGGAAGNAAYTASFSAGSFQLDFVEGSARAVPEPSVIGFLGFAVALFYRRMRLSWVTRRKGN